METSTSSSVFRWTTSDVEASSRFDFYADVVSNAITPLVLSGRRPGEFESNMELAEAGPLTIIRQTGTPHIASRDPRADDRSGEHTLHLMINLCSPWNTSHREQIRLLPGEALIVDSQLDFMLDLTSRYEVVHVKLSPEWLKCWVPSSGRLIGRRISVTSGWGRALVAFVAQLSPQLIVDSPLPVSVLADQLGALLALVASEETPRPATRPERDLSARIRDCIAGRCGEAGLTAPDIAKALNISVRTLHRALTASNETYGGLLMASRAAVAMRMLKSPLLRQVTIAEIGGRAGFGNASHFSRVFHRHYGRLPSQVRSEV
ncbi:AraC family transcriptional regulator [Paraburkholderia sp. BL23I1N1]|uniref:helix-turn-helix transcriptional regulator n=1 Tax=Paraburkholderia sp. BL23I1N1 TaxID=1938802 RepID=UPI000E75E6F8|nr:AraC family transcriptional regulator [Paraburkholderia sp. BL23I1N1]RKE37627.1 AraC family transcriptional regulator [Paraburkholderia sp. BL23I1N1]